MFRFVSLLLAAALCACGGGSGYQPSPLNQRTSDQFKAADKDGNEQLTKAEFEAGFPNFVGHFDEVDVDHNGLVNLAELQSYFEWTALMARPRDGGHKSHGPGY